MRWQITLLESERGWGSDTWTETYDTRAEADQRVASLERQYGNRDIVPDYYIVVLEGPKQVE